MAMIKNTSFILLLMVTACVAACSHNGAAQAKDVKVNSEVAENRDAALVEDITEINLDTDNFDRTKTNLLTWSSVFSMNEQGWGSQERVASFSSQQALVDDTLAHLAKNTQISGKQYIAATMAQRAAGKVDFTKQDLAVIYLTDGGPPFGDLIMRKTVDGVAFCVQRPQPDTPVRGKALKTFFKFYRINKGEKLRRC